MIFELEAAERQLPERDRQVINLNYWKRNTAEVLIALVN